MKYRFVLYGTTAFIKGAPVLNEANIRLRRSFERQAEDENLDDCLKPFDTSRVAGMVRQELDTLSDRQTEVTVRKKRIGYLCVETPFENAHLVWPSLVKIALRENLVVLDAQLSKYTFEPLAYQFSQRDLTLRTNELNEQIKQNTEAIWRIRRVYKHRTERESKAAYVLTLSKSREHDLHERIGAFHKLLSSLLKPGEELFCCDKRFLIKTKRYSVSYTIEAYRKNASLICHMDSGEISVENLHRISCEQAFRWLRNNPGKGKSNYKRTIERMAFDEMEGKYHNPADRFCASYRITKALLKDYLKIDYSCYRYSSVSIMFHKLPLNQCRWPDEYDPDSISGLKIPEGLASFIMPFVKEQYPYFYDRYYLTDNHIPSQMLKHIRDRLAEVRKILLNGENIETLEPFFLHADFYAVEQNKDYNSYRDNKSEILKEMIYRYRLNIAHLYDAFIKWADLQLKYGNQDDLYNIIGP